MLEIMFRFWDLILTVTMFEFANLRSEGFTIGFIVLLNQSAGWLIIQDKHPSKKRVSALYEHYSPKGNRSSDKRSASDPSRHGNYLSYVARAQKAFPNDPISGHVSKMYRKINKATGRG